MAQVPLRKTRLTPLRSAGEWSEDLHHVVVRLQRVAQRSTVEDFTVRLRAVVRDIEGDDGRSRLERQRRERGVRTWTGKDGMWNLHGRFDPESALGLIEALRRETERLFHGEHPADAPADPLLRQQWFQAQALANLMQGRGTRSSEPEFVIVMDHDTFATGERRPDSRVDCGCELDLPIDALLRLAQRARFTPVILDRDGRVVAQGSRVSSPDELVASLRDPVGRSLDRLDMLEPPQQDRPRRVGSEQLRHRPCQFEEVQIERHREPSDPLAVTPADLQPITILVVQQIKIGRCIVSQAHNAVKIGK